MIQKILEVICLKYHIRYIRYDDLEKQLQGSLDKLNWFNLE
jgi:hypothetical protein